jgi:hypothetical protein
MPRKRKIEPPKVHRVIVQLEAPKDGSPGRVTYGYYVVQGDRLTMTGANGAPIVNQKGGRYELTLKPDDDPQVLAALKTREIRTIVHGSDNRFNGPINYPKAAFV